MRAARATRVGKLAALLIFASLAGFLASRLCRLDLGGMAIGARTFAALHPAFAAAAFSVVYVVVAALAVPIVALMTIAAGALFGPWLGVPLAVASSAVGATITMLVARYALRDWVEARFPQLKRRFDGRRGDAAALLFAARVTPALPFALVNVAAALSRMPALTFALVSRRRRAAARRDLRFGRRDDRRGAKPGRHSVAAPRRAPGARRGGAAHRTGVGRPPNATPALRRHLWAALKRDCCRRGGMGVPSRLYRRRRERGPYWGLTCRNLTAGAGCGPKATAMSRRGQTERALSR